LPLLKHRADLRTLGFIGTYYATLAALWVWGPTSPLVVTPIVVGMCLFSWICAIITHNVLHCPVFTWRPANQVFQVLLSLSYGWPVSEYVPGHNKSHHRYTQGRQDVMRTTKVQYRSNLLNFLMFAPRVAGDVTAANLKYMKMAKVRRPRYYRQFQIEASIVWGTKIALLFLDWRKALVFYVIPHLFAVGGITAVNFLQHDGCDPDSIVNGSRNFVGKLFNWFTFNNGYHTIHHLKPSLHWSLLPEAHARLVAPRQHPALAQPSLALYMWRAFVAPGKRVRYDGAPLILPEEGPDQPWFDEGASRASPA